MNECCQSANSSASTNKAVKESGCCNGNQKVARDTNNPVNELEKTLPETANCCSAEAAVHAGDSAEQDSAQDEWSIYDSPDVFAEFIQTDANEQAVAKFQVRNIRCAGCCNQIEKSIGNMVGVAHAEINYSTHQLTLTWNRDQTTPGNILRALSAMDYPAHPVRPGQRVELVQNEYRQLLKQVAVAGALGMQIMVLAVALYAGDWWGMEPGFEAFFRWTSLLLAIPVLVYSGRVFYQGAWRDFKNGRIGMDVPVTLGLTIAFIASLYALLSGEGDVYFDSISMFVFLVLGARLLEQAGKLKAVQALGEYDTVLPDSALLVTDAGVTTVPLSQLKPDDVVRVEAGDVVPGDGTVLNGQSSFDESLLTGESLPITRESGDRVLAGSSNVEHPVTVKLVSTGENTTLSGIGRLVEEARYSKPRISQLVESLSGWFVAVVLLIATGTTIYGYLSGSPDWLPTLIAVLIVSCPCALALATPAAITRAVNSALAKGILVADNRSLETLQKSTRLFTDKTGTLTSGEFRLTDIRVTGSLSKEDATRIAASLEHYSSHPLARAFDQFAGDSEAVTDLTSRTGGGLSGRINDKTYHLGSPRYIESAIDTEVPNVSGSGTVIMLASESTLTATVEAVFELADTVRPGMRRYVDQIQQAGVSVAMLTGDQAQPAHRVAAALGIDEVHAACSPEDKLQIMQQARDANDVVVMLGDGINDAPVVGQADISIAIGENLNLTTSNADIVIMNPDVAPSLERLWALSSQLNRTIRQNLMWALGYNLFAIPFAAMGMVPPWLAAIGMSLSSLVVVLNALRIRVERKESVPVDYRSGPAAGTDRLAHDGA